MASKFSGKIYFCGKMRKFKRCPNKVLKNYQKSVEDYQNKLYPLAEQNRDFQFKMDEHLEELNIINTNMDLLNKLENPSDDEIREAIGLNRDKLELQKKIHALRVEKDEADKKNKENYSSLNDELLETYDEFSTIIFEGFKEGEFVENADSVDFDVAPHLSSLYRLSLSGASQSELDEAYKKLLSESFQ